jgi:hypothetical protein
MAQDGDIISATQPSTGGASNLKTRTQNLGHIVQALADSNSSVLAKLASIASAITASLIGGSTGATDNRLLRSKGTTGRALDASGVTCDDSGNVSTFATLTPNTAGAYRTATSDTNTALLQAYDTNGAAYTTFATLTAGNPPTFNLAAATTKGGVAIAIVNQIVQLPSLWLFPEDGTFKIVVKSAFAWTITETTTITTAGTATVTMSINGTPLGGTANAASTSEQSQAHSSANAVAAGDDISVAFSSTSGDCVNLSLNITGTIVLAAS